MKWHPVGKWFFRIPYLPVLTWTVLILTGSVFTQVEIPVPRQLELPPDKLAHAVAYGVLACLLFLGHSFAQKKVTIWLTIISLLLCIGFGVLLEWVQYWYFPGRHFEYLDMLANTVGVCLGWMIYFFIIK